MAKTKKPSAETVDTMGETVAEFVELRDKVRKLDALHNERIKPLKDKLVQLSGDMLELLNKNGVDSMSTAVGTAYKTTRTTASLEDAESFIDFVTETGRIELLDRRANITSVQEYYEECEEYPPGVKINALMTVGVRAK